MGRAEAPACVASRAYVARRSHLDPWGQEYLNSFHGALLRLAQAQEAPPPRAAPHWIAHGGGAAILLAIVLLVAACGFAYAGKRLRAPLAIARPGGVAAGFMIAIWVGTLVYAAVTFFV